VRAWSASLATSERSSLPELSVSWHCLGGDFGPQGNRGVSLALVASRQSRVSDVGSQSISPTGGPAGRCDRPCA
jgi:hypothetical protein